MKKRYRLIPAPMKRVILGVFGLMALAALTIGVWPTNQDPFVNNAKMAEIYQQRMEQFAGMTPKDLKKLPKYDRPDLAALHEFEMTKDPSLGYIPVERKVASLNDVKRRITGPNQRAIQNVTWTERGPNNVGGRTRALMFDPNDANNQKVWAAGVAGGLWYNNNITSSSTTWQNVNDFWANLAVSTIAYDPSNTQNFYIGTGEGFLNADAVRGAGIWKSTNGGSSWTQLASTNNSDFYYVQKVAVTSSGTVLAATRQGLFRSTNGGSSWTNVLSGGAIADIEIGSNGSIYASRGIAGQTGTMHKSTNDGSSWSTITPTTGGERIEIAVAPSDGNTVYAVASSGGNVAWFRKSTNGGSSWSNVSIPTYLEQSCSAGSQDFTRGQAWYDLILAVHPTNPNIVLAGGIDIHRTTNGGSSWSSVSYWTGACGPYLHADQHAIQFRPGSPDAAIFGNDGGVAYSSNVGNSSASPSFNIRNNGYNVTQFYAVAMENTASSNYMIAGAQDNGSHKFTTTGVNSTSEVTGGDGAFCHIDQDNPNYQITSYVYNSYYRSTNGGGSFSRILNVSNRGRFINPTDYDSDANILYAAGNPDEYIRVSGITGTIGANALAVSMNGAKVSAVIASPHTANRIFLGTDKGTVYRVDNANGSSPSATQVGSGSFPSSGYISCVEIGFSDNNILVTFSNYGVVSVWESRNGGSTWANKEGNLPDLPIRWALYNPNNNNEVMLATEAGVWSVEDITVSSPVWEVTNTGLANVRCDMLQYRTSDKLVAVATHGRGVYTTDAFSGSTPPPPTCDVPTGLASSNVAETTFSLSWTAVAGAVSYDVDINGTVLNSTTNSINLSGATAGTTYACAVRTNCSGTSSAYSSSINVTTQSGSTGGGSGCTGGIAAFPYTESFESGLGAWTQGGGDDNDWTRNSGGTPSNGTGPTSGSAGTWYMYLETSGNGTGYPNKTAYLNSPCFDLSGESASNFSFDYHMTGTDVGSLVLQASNDNGSTWTSIWNISGNQGTAWNATSVDLAAYLGGSVQLRFLATSGSGWSSDIAVDNISVSSSGGSTGGGNGCTGGVAAFPYTESFESGLGAWTQGGGDDNDWTRNSGGTPSNGTGPSSGAAGSWYMYLETSGNGTGYPNKTAYFNSPCFNLSSASSATFAFDYHMNGTAVGSLVLEASNDNGSTWSPIWNISGSQGTAWNTASVNLSAYTGDGVQLRFLATSGSGWSSDIAIDDISLTAATASVAQLVLGGGTEEVVTPEMTVFPNPAKTQVSIQGQGFANAQFSVTDVTGKQVAQGNFVNGQAELQISHLKAGMYIIHTTVDNKSLTSKFIKQ